ncbi:interferon-induced helicase C domain-containing protein 1 [Pelobates fuscus]|uniref:interferon-induced helicase C domain-containing protein 1 n=1 Tax=Pelobates fuscus TaxID=191477 RepID=UPI002FE4C4AE
MADSSSEDVNLFMIKCFRDRLIKTIQITSVLDHLPSLSAEIQTRIKAEVQNCGELSAAKLLLDHIERGPRDLGWFEEFVNALKETECSQAELYVSPENIPSPSLEAKHDECEQLIRILCPELVKKLAPRETSQECFACGICTLEDVDVITTKCRQNGEIAASRELLTRITKKKDWFSKFVSVLRKMEYNELANYLTGGTFEDCTEINGNAQTVTDKHDSNGHSQQEEKTCESLVNSENEKQDLASDLRVHEISCLESSAPPDLNSGCADVGKKQPLETNGTSKEDLNSSLSDLSVNQSFESNGTANEDEDTDMAPEITLRNYQMEVAQPALEGKNIIICLPTGSGKTRVAVYITRQHLSRRKAQNLPFKAIVLVNKVPLVDQHFRREFNPYLKDQYRITKISGDSAQKKSFRNVIMRYDVIICTAQILENSLIQAAEGEEDGVKLSDFSLIIIDECHHTKQDAVYNNIMLRYVKMKIKNTQRKEMNKKQATLPQILGLTASPGVGGAADRKKAEEHILKICANLDADNIMTVKENMNQLQNQVKEPYKKVDIADDKRKNPFGEKIKEIMEKIQNYGKLTPASEFGSQSYEQWVIQKDKSAAKEGNCKEHVCAVHLKKYNDALMINDTIRMTDALTHLTKFYNEERKKKALLDEENEGTPASSLNEADDFLIELFYKHNKELKKMSEIPEYENRKLNSLRRSIMEEFTKNRSSRGIIFTKTRQSAVALCEWISSNEKFKDVGVRPHYLIGAGHNSDFKAMTQNEQKEVINKFSTGDLNLLLATSVAEEGLDIKECNIVIQYGMITNEIAMVQARGRARADDSTYVLVDSSSAGAVERDSINEYKEKMMHEAIKKVQEMPRANYLEKIREFQFENIIEKRVKKKKNMRKEFKHDPKVVTFYCRKCSSLVFSGNDIYVMGNMHHVITSENFKELYIKGENKALQEKCADYETNCAILCKKCGRPWGTMMMHKGCDLPCVKIRNFVVKYKAKKMTPDTFEQWRDLPISFPAFKCEDVEITSDEDEDD